ncbi:hypothetical protein MUY14_14905 [Amycolatopsis sp. FBCC-B4732]|uniref:hypothetical protein n=1 Tax=Amycolatopsis sp. FBCC-B4732 TaxID=3079339 RepID=UPI001FF1E8B3|nr:hypothetical protein [Amycolatopsis sp. FBCC-B4732]UOX91849.1 hypothetical protein MUY14_14905 [Amycolatopsis sp. FBCC-B4732]
MTDLPPAALLDEMTRLRARARADRHAYVPPLLLFGVLVLLAPLWAEGGPPRFGLAGVWFGTPLQLYWLAVVVGGFLATAAWYLYRGHRSGVRTPIRGYLAIGLVGVLGVSLGLPVVESFAYRVARSPYAQPSFTVPVAAVALLAGAGILGLRTRLDGRGARGAATAAAMVCGFVVLAMLDLALAPARPYAPLLTIALGLLGLAWLERSRVLGVVSGLFAASALLVNLYNVQHVFFHLGLFARYEGEATMAFTNTLPPGLVLLAGGAFAAWHERRPRA